MTIERSGFAHACARGVTVAVAVAASACARSGPPAQGPGGRTSASSPPLGTRPTAGGRSLEGGGSARDTELVVNRDIVTHCPTLRLVRAHASEFESDTIWIAVLDAIGDCMREDGPLGRESLGVSGDEAHRHVIRQVLVARGVAPTRVIATPSSAAGAAECQGGAGCVSRVEITIGRATSPKVSAK